MKIYTVQSNLIIIFFLVNTFSLFSQDFDVLRKNTLWIKSNDSLVLNSLNSKLNEELDLNKFFNYNPYVNFSKDKILKKYKNIVTKSFSLFVVFKSSTREENILLSLERGSYKSTLSNKKVVSDREVILNNDKSDSGVIVSYLLNKNSLIGRKNGSLLFDISMIKEKDFKNQLLELIYIPKFVNEKEKNSIESYLSIKYGISLDNDKDYFNSSGTKIWDSKENELYKNRVTGLGRDNFFNLNQKQSKNSLKDGLSIGLEKIKKTNLENDAILNDKSYIIWSDNGKNSLLEKNNENFQKRMQRVWCLKSSSDSITSNTIQIRIDKKVMPIDKNFKVDELDFMWLAVDTLSTSEFNYTNAKFIKATVNNENELIFDNIKINSNTKCLFTIINSSERELISQSLNSSIENLNKVIETTNSNFVLYPNPTNVNEKFSLQFNLIEPSSVLIQIADINGKIIKSKSIENITNYKLDESISVSGTYLILVSINGKLETSKLIVK